MPNLKPFRQFNENDVINFFSFKDGSNVNKGTFVKISTGAVNGDTLNPSGVLGAVYGNTVSNRWLVKAQVTTAGNDISGTKPIGMTLWDIKELDENGEKLIFHPQKAAELQTVLSGQSVPIVSNGQFLYSGVSGTPTGGSGAYLNDSATDGSLAVVGTIRVGTFLGGKDADGFTLLRLELA